MKRKYISRKILRHKWPFSTEEGYLFWEITDQITSWGMPIPYLLFSSEDKTYAINGYARASNRYIDFQEIQLEDPKTKAKKSILPVMDLGLKLLQKENPEIYAQVIAKSQ